MKNISSNEDEIKTMYEIAMNIQNDYVKRMLSFLDESPKELCEHEYLFKVFKKLLESKPNLNQLEILEAINDFDNVLIKKNRQVGVSTILAFKIAFELMQGHGKSIYLISNNLHYCRETLKKVIDIIYIMLDTDYIKFNINNKQQISINNNIFRILSPNCSILHVRNNPYWVIFDEVCFIDQKYIKDMYFSIKEMNPIKITLISTPYFIDKLFFPIYILGKKAGYKVIESKLEHSHYDEKTINKFKINTPSFTCDSEYNGKFMVEDYDIDINEITDLIKPYLIEGQKFLLSDLIKAIQNIVTKKINYEYNC